MIHVPANLNGKGTVYVTFKEGTTILEIAEVLKQKELINSKFLFLVAIPIMGKKLIAGEYEFKRDSSIREIIRKMKKGERKIYVLRIVEGNNIFDVSKMLEQTLGIKEDDFLRLSRNEEFLRRLNIKSCSLEGYLYPDTYFYSKEIEIDKLIERIVSRTKKFFERPDVKKRMEELGLDMHETLTLASLIEKEAKVPEEKPLISAVFHNRLRMGMRLECDPTVLYGLRKHGPITKRDLIKKTDYNTYTFKGLPPGPICNPSISSIYAALYPAPTDYLYFVSRNDGTHVFSNNLKEHTKYVKIYQKKNKNVN